MIYGTCFAQVAGLTDGVAVTVLVLVLVTVLFTVVVVLAVHVTTVVFCAGQGFWQRADLMQPVGQAVAPMVQPLGETVQSLVTSWATIAVVKRATRAIMKS